VTKKLQPQTVSTEKLDKDFCNKKAAHKMLMKLTPGLVKVRKRRERKIFSLILILLVSSGRL